MKLILENEYGEPKEFHNIDPNATRVHEGSLFVVQTGPPRWTIFATGYWSTARLEDDDEQVAQ